MQTSQKGLALIKEEEGFSSKAYPDVAGFKTIGWGHKVGPTDNFPVYGITEAQAETVLHEDLSHVEWFINHYLSEINATVNQDQFDALVDFAFNLGVGALHKLLSHGINNVKYQILRWDHASGKELISLKDRRQKELALWNTPSVEDVTESV